MDIVPGSLVDQQMHGAVRLCRCADDERNLVYRAAALILAGTVSNLPRPAYCEGCAPWQVAWQAQRCSCRLIATDRTCTQPAAPALLTQTRL